MLNDTLRFTRALIFPHLFKGISKKMNIFKRWIFTVLCLPLAISCYVYGVPVGGALFLLAGIVFELLFWFGLIGRLRKKDA